MIELLSAGNYPIKYSIKKIARIGGILYFVIIVAGFLGEMFVRGKLVVSGDVAATATNIMQSPLLWRIGIAGDLVMHVCDVPLMVIFYLLLRPVNKYLALTALVFNVVQTAVLAINKLNLLTPLFVLGGADYMKVFDTGQLQALSYLSIKYHGYGFGIGLIFFGFTAIILGYLIIRSGYIPKFIGILMQIAGLCYVVNSFILIINPGLSDKLYPWILLLPLIAELSLCLFMIFKGVNITKWQEKIISVMG